MWWPRRKTVWRRVDITPADTPTAFPPEHVWADVVSIVSALDERDRARRFAVALESQNAYLIDVLRDLLAACAPDAPLLTIDDVESRIRAALEVIA